MIRIRQYRERAGLTMKELGAKVGCTESAISNYELGKRKPDYEMLLKMSEALGTDVAHLLGTAPEDDGDLSGMLEDLRARPELRILLQSSRDMSPDQVRAIVQMIEGFRK
jgi:transcriptional regulator with XRE-family HTH domain